MEDRPRPVTPPPANARSPWVQLRAGSLHPFIYRKMVRQADPDAQPGDLVNVYDKYGSFFGRGLYNPRSQIVVRMLSRNDVPIDDDFWHSHLQQAVELRRRLNLDQTTDAYRLVHAEGDGLSGLIVERYADCLVFELFSLGMYRRQAQLSATLASILGPPTCLDRPNQAAPTWHTIVRADQRVEQFEGFRLSDDKPTAEKPPTRVTIREHDLRYRVDVQQGQKTGFFCDQRDNRRRLANLCRDASVLDLCCYTGGFSLCAAKLGGAREVIGVDLDEAAIAVARENANLNQTRVDFVHSDAFIYMRQMLANHRQFDTVILDPPKLAVDRAEYEDALRKYSDFNHLAVRLVRPGGLLLTCSCSGLVPPPVFTETVHQAGNRCGRTLQLIEQTAAAPDHPVMMNCPESAYLKALWFRVL